MRLPVMVQDPEGRGVDLRSLAGLLPVGADEFAQLGQHPTSPSRTVGRSFVAPLSGFEHLLVFGGDVVECVGDADLHRCEAHGSAPREGVGEVPVDQLGHADGKFQREWGGMGVSRLEHDPPHVAPFAEFGKVLLRKPPVPARDDVDQLVDGR